MTNADETMGGVCSMVESLEATEKDACLSDTRSHELLLRLYAYGKGREDISIVTAEWIKEYPDLMQLLEESKQHHEIMLFPHNTEGCLNLTFEPLTLELLKNTPKSPAHRQVTVEGHKVDVRSLVGAVLTTPNIANLADACRCWLADVDNEDKASVQRKVRINLQRAIGMRGAELASYDPLLKVEIMKVLTASRPTNP
jgi:hypothetical protein